MHGKRPDGAATQPAIRTPLRCLQYYKNFKSFKTQVDCFRGRLQTLLTSLPVGRLPLPAAACVFHWPSQYRDCSPCVLHLARTRGHAC